ncbi:MAG: putative Ig domain-containing protein [Candidatus Thiodiazotropha sp.]
MTEINQLHAGTDYFTFDKAVWRDKKDLLVFKGTGTPKTTVELFVAGTDISLGTKTVNKRGMWRFKFYNPDSIPCSVRAENSTNELEKDVYRAPADCSSQSESPTENTAPVISGSPRTQVAEGDAYSFTPSASDVDGDSLSFSIMNKPSWANFSKSSGKLSGTPGYSAAGTTENIQISVSDGSATASLDAFSITVDNTNRAPSISGTPASYASEGISYSFIPQASDADGDKLSFSIQNKPSWASFDSATGNLSGTPDYSDTGTTSNIYISVSDGYTLVTLQAFSITVDESNQAPIISGTPATSVSEGADYSFVPHASDADGDKLSFSIDNKPSWANFSTSTGALSGTPGYSDAGTTGNIRISVSDGNAVTSLNTFSITVDETNRAPSISGAPTTNLDEGSSYSFTPAASDPDGDALTFSISNLPYWASFNESNGNLTGTPDSDSAGSYQNIVISVSDGSERVSLDGFTITISDVADPNNAPVISGSAEPNIIAGNEYWFAPNASDADGDELTFSVSNLPLWASFNTNTGAISGNPSSEDIGLYSNIVISVTDGIDSATLSPQSITVVEPEPTVGSISLMWVPPSTRTDGSALDLSEIEGYKIYMGTTSDNLTQIVDLADSTINEHVVDNLATGDYYFAVTTYDTEGNESAYSNVAMKSTM